MIEDTSKKPQQNTIPRMLILMDRDQGPTKFEVFKHKINVGFQKTLDVVGIPLLVLGIVLNTYFVLYATSAFNIVCEILYLFALTSRLKNLKRKRNIGSVSDAETNAPIDLAMVRVSDGKRFVLVRATDAAGNFFLVLQPGNYTIFASKVGYETASKKISVPRGKIITADISFKLKKKGGQPTPPSSPKKPISEPKPSAPTTVQTPAPSTPKPAAPAVTSTPSSSTPAAAPANSPTTPPASAPAPSAGQPKPRLPV